jgi:NAD(P)-dependent dehydrogenase (short-subunit alcohol dehydrogenase family)
MKTCSLPHILVTGASSGIGRATALHLAAGGYHVYAGIRKPADSAALEEAARERKGELTPLLLDVTNAGQITAAVGTIAGHAGQAGLAGLVNNAGIGVFGPLEIIPIEQFRYQLEVNVTGQLALTQAVLPLLRQARGRIVMIGSIGARFAPPFTGALSASKSSLATMDEALRQELAPWGIRVVLIEPATIRTEAVGKLRRDADQLMSEAGPHGRALYEESFGAMVRSFTARHHRGSPPEMVAETVAHALAAPRPRARYLVGKDSRKMALLAALLPAPALDAVRRKLTRQPAPGSRAYPAPASPADAPHAAVTR